MEIPPWTKCHFWFLLELIIPSAGSRHHQAEPVPVTSISGAPLHPAHGSKARAAHGWPGSGRVCAAALSPRLWPHSAPAAGLEPRGAHPHCFSSGTSVGKCESVTNVGVHLFYISWAGLSQGGFVLRPGSVRVAKQGWDGAGLSHEVSCSREAGGDGAEAVSCPQVPRLGVGALPKPSTLHIPGAAGGLQRSLAYRMCLEGSSQKRQDLSKAA